jgi:hypothetical protein
VAAKQPEVVPGQGKGKQPRLSSKKKKEAKQLVKEGHRLRLIAAAKDWKLLKFPSVTECAKAHGVNPRTLHYGITLNDGQFAGSGKKACILTKEEELMVANHCRYVEKIGYGENLHSVRLLVQELLTRVKAARPDRITGLEDQQHLPSHSWVNRFCERNGLTLRKASVISKGRAVVSPAALGLWFSDIEKYIKDRPALVQAMQDPKRIFNYDETAMELGVGVQRVLAPVAKKQVYTVSSSTREHVTLGMTVSAAGDMVPPRVVFSGKRNLATTKLSLPVDGRSGVWTFSYTHNGWVDQDIMLIFIKDLGSYMAKQAVPKPAILFMDGATCHMSLEIAELCEEQGIQPILLRPNTTHLTQPLDLTFFQSFKAELQKEKEGWHRANVGLSLNKYSIIPLAHIVTERILRDKPTVIGNGFKSGGIYPWDPQAPTGARMDPSLIYQQTVETEETAGDAVTQEDASARGSGASGQGSGGSGQGRALEAASGGSGQGRAPEEASGGSGQEQDLEAALGGSGQERALEDASGGSGQEQDLEDASGGSGQGQASQTTDQQLATSTLDLTGLPETKRFLARFELLLSRQELDTFNSLYLAGSTEVDNIPYQSWLLLKRGLEPQLEREAAKEVHCTALHCTALLTVPFWLSWLATR